MSLQVWLPLNGNLNNNGISSLTINSSNASYKTGKIGNGLNLSTNINCTASGMAGVKEFTVAFWSYCDADTSKTSDWVRLCYLYDATSSNSTGAGFRFETCYSSNLNSRGVSWHNNGTYAITEGSVLIGGKNQWHHICVTVKSGQVKTYDNGTLINTTTATKGGHLTGQFYLGSSVTGCMNDFRLYDNVLSPREVKELAKGLVLHYPLNQPERNPNLIRDSLINTTSSSYGFAGRNVSLLAGKTYTLSFNGRKEVDDSTANRLYIYLPDWSWSRNFAIRTLTDSTEFITFTAPKDATYSVTAYSFAAQSTAGSAVTVNWYKLEEGSVSTPWCPATTDSITWSDGIEYDVSGYGNNGTILGSISCTSGSPRNTNCYNMSSGEILTPIYTDYFTDLTYACWVKLNEYTSDRCCICIGGTYITVDVNGRLSGYAYGKSPAGYHTGTKVIPLNTWTHIAIVWDDSYIYGYINGILDFKVACTGSFSNHVANAIGKEHGYGRQINGYLSDFRIYATALGASDIKELYSTPISITKNGTLMVRGEFLEE